MELTLIKENEVRNCIPESLFLFLKRICLLNLHVNRSTFTSSWAIPEELHIFEKLVKNSKNCTSFKIHALAFS